MLVLMQLISLMQTQAQLIMLCKFFEEAVEEHNAGEKIFEDQVEDLPDFLFNHFHIQVELTEIQKSMLVRILTNGSWKSAFKIADVKAMT